MTDDQRDTELNRLLHKMSRQELIALATTCAVIAMAQVKAGQKFFEEERSILERWRDANRDS